MPASRHEFFYGERGISRCANLFEMLMLRYYSSRVVEDVPFPASYDCYSKPGTGKGPMDQEPNRHEPEEGSLWLNIGKIVLLIAVLVAAWFVLERLMGGK